MDKKTAQPTADPIYEAVKARIMMGKLAPGEPLRQDDIARVHGVSKIPVREALLRLESEGFVQFRKNRGAIVRGLSRDEALHLMDIRVALECKALEGAIPHMATSDLDLAKAIIGDYEHETTAESWSALNIRFHRALYAPCGNDILLQMIEDVRARMGPVLRLMVTETTGFARPHEEHVAILAACEAGNVEKSVELLRQHIETTKKETGARLRRQAAE